VNKTQNVVVNKNINITNLQNVNALAPLSQVNNTRVTNLVTLNRNHNKANNTIVDVRNRERDAHVIKLESVPQENRARVQQAAKEYHAAAQQRRQSEARLLTQAADRHDRNEAPRPVKVELPRAAVRAAAVRAGAARVAAPPPPVTPKFTDHQPPRVQQPPATRPPRPGQATERPDAQPNRPGQPNRPAVPPAVKKEERDPRPAAPPAGKGKDRPGRDDKEPPRPAPAPRDAKPAPAPRDAKPAPRDANPPKPAAPAPKQPAPGNPPHQGGKPDKG
jgi:hypothetical protein